MWRHHLWILFSKSSQFKDTVNGEKNTCKTEIVYIYREKIVKNKRSLKWCFYYLKFIYLFSPLNVFLWTFSSLLGNAYWVMLTLENAWCVVDGSLTEYRNFYNIFLLFLSLSLSLFIYLFPLLLRIHFCPCLDQ